MVGMVMVPRADLAVDGQHGFSDLPLTTTMMSLGSDSGGSVIFLRGPDALAAVVEAVAAPVSSEPAHAEPATESQNEEQ